MISEMVQELSWWQTHHKQERWC